MKITFFIIILLLIIPLIETSKVANQKDILDFEEIKVKENNQMEENNQIKESNPKIEKVIEKQEDKEIEKIEGIKTFEKSILEDIRFKKLKDKSEEAHQTEIERLKKVGK